MTTGPDWAARRARYSRRMATTIFTLADGTQVSGEVWLALMESDETLTYEEKALARAMVKLSQEDETSPE